MSQCYTNNSETYMPTLNAPYGFITGSEFTKDVFYPYISAQAVSSPL